MVSARSGAPSTCCDRTALRSLQLSLNNISDAGAEALAVAMEGHNTLERLDLCPSVFLLKQRRQGSENSDPSLCSTP